MFSPNSDVSGPRMMDQVSYAGSGQSKPISDARQNFVFVNMTVEDGWTNVKFYRCVCVWMCVWMCVCERVSVSPSVRCVRMSEET